MAARAALIVGSKARPGYVNEARCPSIPVNLHIILSCGLNPMKQWLIGIVWVMGCLCTPAVAAIRLVPDGHGGFHMVFTTPPPPPAPPPARVPPHPAWLKPSYLLGTWKIVGKWGMTGSAVGGVMGKSIRQRENSEIGRTVTFTRTRIIYTPLFLGIGKRSECVGAPRYTVKVIPIHIRDVVLPKSYLQWSGPPGDYAPYREHKVVELKAECTWQRFRNMPLFDFQLTRTGELASASDMGFFLLKKIGP